RGDWLPEYFAYVGTNAPAASARPLCRAGRRTVARPRPVGLLAIPLLLTGEGAQSCLSRQVRRRFAARLSPEETELSRRVSAAVEREGIHRVIAHLVPKGLGGLRQATFWWAGTRAAVSGSVHAPGSNLEPSNRRRQRCPRDVPLEGLRPSQQAPYDELNPRGVPAPLPAACPAQGFPSYSLLRILGQPPARGVSVAMPHAISACAARSADGFRNRSGPLVLSLLPGTDARDQTAYGGTDPARRKQTGLHPC